MKINLDYNILKPKRGDVVKINDSLYFCYHGLMWIKMSDSDIQEMEKQLNGEKESEEGTESTKERK